MTSPDDRHRLKRELRRRFIDAAGPDTYLDADAFADLGVDRPTARAMARASHKVLDVADAEVDADYWTNAITARRAELAAKSHDPAALADEVSRW